MKRIFEKGTFREYRVDALNEAAESMVHAGYQFAEKKTTVFISHKHDELDELKDIIGFLEKKYNVKAYIDSNDLSMPKATSEETAERIKEKIEKCDNFILLATDGAIESKWCNWELGYGDAYKYKGNKLALFSMKDKGTNDALYKGNEYLKIYPYIVYTDGDDQYSDGNPIPKGYYVRYRENGKYYITPLDKWFK